MVGTSSTLMPAVGSSNMKMSGSSASRIATSSLRWSPCGSAAARVRPAPSGRTCGEDVFGRRDEIACASAIERDRSRPAPRLACTARRTFSRTVRFGNRLVSWKARPMPRRVRAATREPRDVVRRREHAAGGRPELAGDQVEVGRLAGAVGADDRGQRAGMERAAHPVDGDVAAEADGQVARLRAARHAVGHRRGWRPRVAAPRRRRHDLSACSRIGTCISAPGSRAPARAGPTPVGLDLDPEVVHRLQRLMILLAEASSCPWACRSSRPSMAVISFSVSVPPAFFSASTTAGRATCRRR